MDDGCVSSEPTGGGGCLATLLGRERFPHEGVRRTIIDAVAQRLELACEQGAQRDIDQPVRRKPPTPPHVSCVFRAIRGRGCEAIPFFSNLSCSGSQPRSLAITEAIKCEPLSNRLTPIVPSLRSAIDLILPKDLLFWPVG